MTVTMAFVLGVLLNGIILAPFSYVWWRRRGSGRFLSIVCAIGTLIAPASVLYELTH